MPNKPIRLAIYDPARVVYLRRRRCPRWLRWVALAIPVAVAGVVLVELATHTKSPAGEGGAE